MLISCPRWRQTIPSLTEWPESYRDCSTRCGGLTTLTERLAARASLSPDEAQDVRRELETTRTAVEQLGAILTLRRQNLWQI